MPEPTRVPNRLDTDLDGEARPTSVLVITTWNILQATFGLLSALLIFGTQESIKGKTVDLPLWETLLQALSSVTLCAVLITLSVMLARRQQSIRLAQFVVLAIQAGLLGLTALVAYVNRDPGPAPRMVYGAVLFALLDAVLLVLLTSPRLKAWFNQPGPVPGLLRVPVAVWAATAVAVDLVDLLRGIAT